MGLIQCKRCGKRISNAAAACPTCASPLSVAIVADREQCPFCMTAVHKNATVCPACHSMKGYATNTCGVMGKGSVITFGAVLPAIVTLAYLPAGILCIPLALLCLWHVGNGPYWYRSEHVQ